MEESSLKDRIRAELESPGYRPCKLIKLAKQLHVRGQATEQLEATLHQMEQAGEVVCAKRGRYFLPERLSMAAGTFRSHREGFGFVILHSESDKQRSQRQDIYISPSDTHGAMDGDRVVARITGRGRFGRLAGEITRITERVHHRVVGTLEWRGNQLVVAPIHERLSQVFVVPLGERAEAVAGQVVVAEIMQHPDRYGVARARVVEILGQADDPNLDAEIIIRKHQLRDQFPEQVIEEAERVPLTIQDSDLTGRRDLRDNRTVTIDDEDAKDLDDAVSLEIEDGVYRLSVHIADVSHYVLADSALDLEARQRATSVYLSDRCLPMLPQRLSNGICSLNAVSDRLTMSAVMDYDKSGRLLRHEIFPSVIKTAQRMTYTRVWSILQREGSSGDPALDRMISQMGELAAILRNSRRERGSLDFELPEAKALFDEEGRVTDIRLREQNAAHNLIEEFMIAANEVVARELTHRMKICVYRVHASPEPEKVDAFLEVLSALGHKTIYLPAEPVPKDFQQVISAVRGESHENLVMYLLLRSMQEARYQTENIGHFGLASDCYCHFTSPIRRYPDLMVHRLLKSLLAGGGRKTRQLDGEQLSPVADHCSIQERVAQDAERESLELKQIRFLAERVGDEFEGIITGVQPFGIFVEICDHLIEGLIRVGELADDYYVFEDDRHQFCGENTGKVYRLGDRVKVQVLSVDIEERQVNYRIAEEEVETAKRKRSSLKKGAPRKARLVARRVRRGHRRAAF